MNALLTSPFALVALMAVPVLIGIYLLRNRFRIHPVSSLIFWTDRKKSIQGGINLDRIQTPLLFILELLAISLMALAAAGPMIHSGSETSIFVFILDNSFSMTANDESSPRDDALKDIQGLLRSAGRFQARFILAGNVPVSAGRPAKTLSEIQVILKNWTCTSPGADLPAAVSLALELTGKTARIIVFTDHAPKAPVQSGRIEYRAFGKPLSNVAFVNAGRTSGGGLDRCLLSLVNLGGIPARPQLIVETVQENRIILRQTPELEPGLIHRIVFETDFPGPLRAYIEPDPLIFDNEVYLAALPSKKLKIGMDIRNEALHSAIRKGVDSVEHVQIVSLDPQMVFFDSERPAVDGDCWAVHILADPNAVSYIGPFITDITHPLSEGLSLQGVIWAAAPIPAFTGDPIIAAGNIPLLTDSELPGGGHLLTLHLNLERSTLIQSPNWPILCWNMIEWRKSYLPGLSQAMIPLGGSLTFRKDSPEQKLDLIGPDGSQRNISSPKYTAVLNPKRPGLYRLRTDTEDYSLAVNALSQSESDLLTACTDRWGDIQEADMFWWEYRPVDWILLLAALGLLTFHRYLTARYLRGTGV